MNGIRLSPKQRQVVNHDGGALLVVAGPGAGKTRVLTERIRRLLSEEKRHFRVLALTFTNKAANEMAERLQDLGDRRTRAFIGTLHGFCLEVLTNRGKPVGIVGTPQIFEQAQDRKQILLEAVQGDPILTNELSESGDEKEQTKRLDNWLRSISFIKAHPISQQEIDDPIAERAYEAYNAGLRASGAYDFDDLLLLTYQLLVDYPKIADFYRRLYEYICIDEAQDLNEAQYCVIRALSGDDYKNVMMVGDPKQSIYGFNTSSPEYMERFREDFSATSIELTENYRCSRAVVAAAKAIDPNYVVAGQLPVKGSVNILVGADEEDEAKLVIGKIEELVRDGHPDIEGEMNFERCAILGRTRFTLLAVEELLKSKKIPHYKRLSAIHQNESKIVDEFLTGLRVIVNPKDRMHLSNLAKKWKVSLPDDSLLQSSDQVINLLGHLSIQSKSDRCKVITKAFSALGKEVDRLNLMPAIEVIRAYADSAEVQQKRLIYEDTVVLTKEWDYFLRTTSGVGRSITGFLSSMALGITQQSNLDGVALLTVHSAKGLEFEAVFVVGMADGVFPDYRARGDSKASQEELRNAFVAFTRSKRLLFLSYPKTRKMPWGDIWLQQASPFLADATAAVVS